jgi:uncharacterized protein YeaO (DUF488 family)
MTIKLKRIYAPYSTDDGYRVLVDRLWPRGIKKEDAHIDKWIKEVGPSTALRKWFNHEPEKWEEFCKKYHDELTGSPAFAELISFLHIHKTITLLFASKEEKYNQAIALKQFINEHGPM